MVGQGGPESVLRVAAFVATVMLNGRAETALAADEVGAYQRDRATLRSVHFVDPQNGWTVGDHGAIWHTNDSGLIWKLQNTGTTLPLHAVQFLDPQRGWCAGGEFLAGISATRGIFLRTGDGGQTWHQDSKLILPSLYGIHFEDADRGWAWGEPSGLYPLGVLHTSDGGRSWSPVGLADSSRDSIPSAAAWIGGTSLHRRLLLVDRHGRIGGTAGHHLEVFPRSRDGISAGVIAVSGDPRAQHLIAAGRNGVLTSGPINGDTLGSEDRSAVALPAPAFRHVEWQAITAHGSQVWVAGSPGSVILHSTDAGKTWESQATGQTLPVSALTFADSLHGWAVGAGSTILSTDNGGQSWKIQRQAKAEADLLVVSLDAAAVPWDSLAEMGGISSVVWTAGERPWDDESGSAATRPARSHQAVLALDGLAGASGKWPLRPEETQRESRLDVEALWDRVAGRPARELLIDQLGVLLRTWRPNILTSPRPDGDTAAGFLGQVVESAWQAAGSDTNSQELEAALHLPPHRPSRWCIEVNAQRRRSGALASGTGPNRLAAALVGRAEIQVQPITFQVRTGEGVGTLGLHAVLGGISRDPRAIGPDDEASKIDVARRLRNLRATVEFAPSRVQAEASLRGEVENALRDLDAVGSVELLLGLSESLRAAGRGHEASDVDRLFLERFPEHALGPQTAWRLLRQSTSAEGSKGVAQRQTVVLGNVDRAAPKGPGVEQVGAAYTVDDRRVAHLEAAKTVAELLNQRYPHWAFEPEVQLSLAAWHRRQGHTELAADSLKSWGTSRPHDSWWNAAQGERWLLEPHGDCPLPRTQTRLDAPRPTLDGRLDDATWSTTQPLNVTSPWRDDADWPTTTWLAADRENLYLAVICRRATGAEYVPAPPSRPRDGHLSERDRVSWSFDVDRNFDPNGGTALTLTIDQRGWTSERVGRDSGWNPRWFVSQRLENHQWTAEAAIAWTELRGTGAPSGETWLLSIERIVPHVGIQTWPPRDADETARRLPAWIQFATPTVATSTQP